ncbi:Hypothetical predicted protein [Octopus vulgaris]|uniref:Uncharacterized protein n=1 Tax=Octopus vulgaris TaxID=6645 RepID=A0AA36ASW7_OCTVU|nr:Hypothetical predicted protein [Octopus vulgaris]
MGLNYGSLTASKKSVITFELAKGKSTLEISKIIGGYHQTVKSYYGDTRVTLRTHANFSHINDNIMTPKRKSSIERKTRNAASTSRTRSDEAYRQAEKESDTEAQSAKRQHMRDTEQQRNTSAGRSRTLNPAARDAEQQNNTPAR